MSRHGYSEDDGDEYDQLVQGRFEGQLASAIRGKRGQAFLRDLIAALDALPEKKLISNVLEAEDGSVCALGALGRYRGVDVKTQDSDWETLSRVFDVAPRLTQEVMYLNDEVATDAAARWLYVRRWAERRLKP